jgi:hypothetical protein
MTGRKLALCLAMFVSFFAAGCAATREADPQFIRSNSICVRESAQASSWQIGKLATLFIDEVVTELERRGYETLPISMAATGIGCPLVLDISSQYSMGYSHVNSARLFLSRRGVIVKVTDYAGVYNVVRPASDVPSVASIVTDMLDELLKQVSPS